MARTLTWFDHVLLGIVNRYPVCCIVRFAFVSARRPEAFQALERGGSINKIGEPYVPCGIFHQFNVTHPKTVAEWQAEFDQDE